MSTGRFGPYGGQFVPETLMAAVTALEEGRKAICPTDAFRDELAFYLTEYAGRETPLTFCRNVSADMGCKVYLKREDLLHSGAHKLNNTLGQGLLARHMGKKRLIAETGAGQHGVATAIAGAVLGLPVEVYMGETDCKRQQLNVFRMELMGAKVIPVSGGTATLKDAVNEAMREWAATSEDSAYILGSVVGPHPYPEMVRDFQTVIGIEARQQIREHEGRLPDEVIACVGGGSNAIGIFHPFLKDDVALTGVEAGGRGKCPGDHGASLGGGTPGVLHGALSYLLQDADGQVLDTYSVAAGLDYPAVGPEHSMLKDTGRVRYGSVLDDEVLNAFRYLSRKEGIIPALESSHAVAYLLREQDRFDRDDIVIVNLSGRGDKDISREVVHAPF
ncbi:tryptophan synthase subunit beta [Methanogenium organophilum]|uniref:Tryptophan synthase beta chain n=1 Tax=Methanogenium organophilum TaxID=2199 RepID=A0A9X9S5Y9_METOG|nr:tryptophan synthase subunit beta [Methanogenium organophilum]WAI02038.1 tryptophan synthase subunit beta [Methanogenium organophilum]